MRMETMSDDTRDKVIRLETQLQNVETVVKELVQAVDQLNALLNQAKGAKWLFLGTAAAVGFITSKLGAIAIWFTQLPR